MREWANRADKQRQLADGAAAAARDRARVQATARRLDENNIRIEVERRTRIAEARFAAEVGRSIDHLDERNVWRWDVERRRIESQVRRQYYESNRALTRRIQGTR